MGEHADEFWSEESAPSAIDFLEISQQAVYPGQKRSRCYFVVWRAAYKSRPFIFVLFWNTQFWLVGHDIIFYAAFFAQVLAVCEMRCDIRYRVLSHPLAFLTGVTQRYLCILGSGHLSHDFITWALKLLTGYCYTATSKGKIPSLCYVVNSETGGEEEEVGRRGGGRDDKTWWSRIGKQLCFIPEEQIVDKVGTVLWVNIREKSN